MAFSIDLYDLNPVSGVYTRKDILQNFERLQFFSRKNSSGAARFSLSGYSPKATASNLRRLRTIAVINFNGVIIWSGFINRPSPRFTGMDYTWDVECLEYFARLKKRYTDMGLRFDQTGQGTIAWDLIDYTQTLPNGQLGIVQGSVDNSTARDRSYEVYNIAEAIENLTNVIGGFDFEVVPQVDAHGLLTSHRFDTFNSMGVYRSDLPQLALGSTVLSFRAFNQEDIYNEQIYKGAGTGNSFFITRSSDSASQLNYSLNQSARLREDVSDETTLQSIVDRQVQESKDNIYTMELTLRPDSNLDPFSFNISDTLNINLDTPEMTKKFMGTCEVITKEFLVDPQGVLECSIKISFVDNE